MPTSSRPILSDEALAEWCRQSLGAVPIVKLFEAGFLSTVKGLQLSDGREVVVKVRPYVPRLAGCAAVHRALRESGFPCSEPLLDLQRIGSMAISAEMLVSSGAEVPSQDVTVHSAAALARLIELAPEPTLMPPLAPSPSWAGWDHAGLGVWPVSEQVDTNLNDTLEPLWLTRVAVALRGALRSHGGMPVIGHGDWHPENLRWRGVQLVAAFDWDSAICQPEPAIVGLAAVSFRGIQNISTMATVNESAAFIAAYQNARGCTWTPQDNAMSWAAGLWQRVVDAKVESLTGDPDKSLTRDEAAGRLSRAGLDPRLVTT